MEGCISMILGREPQLQRVDSVIYGSHNKSFPGILDGKYSM